MVDPHTYSFYSKVTPFCRELNLEGACLHHWQVMNVTLATVVGEWSLAVTDCQLYLNGGYNRPYHPATGDKVSGSQGDTPGLRQLHLRLLHLH